MALHLITGVAGFIGSNLARELLRRGERVRGVDDFSTGRRVNLADIASQIDFRELSILDLPRLTDACRGTDYIYHQAAIPSVPRSVADPLLSNTVNVDGTVNLLVAAREAKVKRVVYAASSSVYGDTPTLPKHEDMVPNPISPYAVAKLTGEHYMASFFRVYGLETVSLRYFNIFGPWQDPTSMYSAVFAKFITSMLEGKSPIIFGDGEQSRDFTYIENAVSANLLAAGAPREAVCARVFNVATGARTTLNKAFATLKKLIGFSGEPVYLPDRAGDIKHSLADISLAQKYLGYSVLVPFEEGLGRTVDWYRAQPSQKSAPAVVSAP